MTQHEVITQIRDAIITGDYGLAVRALNEYRDFEIEQFLNQEFKTNDPYPKATDTAKEQLRKLGYNVEGIK